MQGKTAAEAINKNTRIFPNPATGSTTVFAPAGTSIASIQFFNMQGKLEMNIAGNKNNSISVNLSPLNAGTYFSRINFTNGSVYTTSITRK